MNRDQTFTIRCTQTDRQVIADLARRLGVRQSEAVRRAVLLAAKVIARNSSTIN